MRRCRLAAFSWVALAALLLGACAPAAPSPTAAPAKPAEAKPAASPVAAPAAAPAASPAAAPAAAPAASPAAAPAAAPAASPAAAPAAAPAASPAAAAPVAPSKPAGPLKKITLLLGTPTISANDAYTVSVPKELGYFAEEGLDVDVQPISSGGQANQLLAAGQAQVGFNAAVGTLTGRAQSVNLKAVYNYLRKHATGIVVLEASPIKTPQDLKGKTIGTASVGSARALDARAMVKAAGLNPDTDVTFQVAGIGAQGLTALQQGRVDALSLWDATYVDMENLGAKLRRFNFPFQEGIFSYVLQGMEDYIDKNPDVIVGVGRALAKATVFAETNPEAATRIHLKLYPVQTAADPNKIFQDSLAVVKDNLKNGALEPGLTNYGSFSRQSWEKVVDYYIELGLLKEKPPIERLYVSDDLNRQMNQFDRAAIQRQAREWKG